MVNWDGGFSPCCYLTDKSDDFGDLKQNTVAEIWNNDHYTTARGLFKNDYMPEKNLGCMSCSVYLGSRAARKRGPLTIPLQPVSVVKGASFHRNGASGKLTEAKEVVVESAMKSGE